MPNWIDLGPAADYSENAQVCTQLTVDGKKLPVVVFNVAGQLHCLADTCPHAGMPLGGGERRGMTITCPFHGYTYSLKNGKDLDDPEFGTPAKVYRVRVENGVAQIDLDRIGGSEAENGEAGNGEAGCGEAGCGEVES